MDERPLGDTASIAAGSIAHLAIGVNVRTNVRDLVSVLESRCDWENGRVGRSFRVRHACLETANDKRSMLEKEISGRTREDEGRE